MLLGDSFSFAVCRLISRCIKQASCIDLLTYFLPSFLIFVRARGAHTCMSVWRPQVGLGGSLYQPPPYFWRQGFPPNLELHSSARLAVQKAPGTCPPPPPSHLSTLAPAPCFDVSARDANSGPPAYTASTVVHSATSPPWPSNFLIRSF